MIQLTEPEKKWIKFTKMHYKEKYPYKDGWIESAKPLFEEIYGWSPDDSYDDYKQCLFTKLLDIQLKISDDGSQTEQQIKSVFNACFYKTFNSDCNEPIDRAINTLIGLIQSNLVKDRYDLTLKDDKDE